jgi:histone H2A
MKMAFPNLDRGITAVQKQVHPAQRVSTRVLSMLTDLAQAFADQVVSAANMLSHHTSRAQLTSRDVVLAFNLVLPGELAKHAVSNATKAVLKRYKMASERGVAVVKATKMTLSAKAGLTLPVPRISKYLRTHSVATKQGVGAGVALAAGMEYLISEILELAGNATRDLKKTTIKPRHVLFAVRGDEELDALFRRVYLGGGVVPHIYAVLLPKSTEKHKSDGY